MPSDYARRGRPRGSGLDDRGQLRQIAEMLDADPTLKPTTAIKAIGVSDPSTIRRLREKLKVLPHPARSGDTALGGVAQTLEPLLARSQSKPVSPAPGSYAGLAEVQTSGAPDAKLSFFMQWCALGLSAVSSTVEAQMAMLDDLLQVPQVASALRQQLLFNEVAKAFCPKRSDVRSTLH
ncbi:hypothetical protein [Hyphomicrobium sp.]|uniref:hypothetical protein n=1 Tax=Hyphomicrobium sp. TaxID=82 RepID=UPI002E31B9C7|nr:hypothetical protein [Hyphomicrobium sp.]HEX2840616.1 hypothetical protein [Hyphomicrobium sp.]